MGIEIIKHLTKLDSQVQEIISRNILIHKLLENDFEAAIPIRDCGIDLLVYSKKSSTVIKKIQLKSFNYESFSFHKKYLKVNDLWFIYIMNISITENKKNHIMYGMSTEDVLNVIKTAKIRPNKDGYYYRKSISKELHKILKPFELNDNSKFRHFFNNG